MILKFQKPLATNDPHPQVLITNKNGDVIWFRPYQGPLKLKFGDRVKFYADCRIIGQSFVFHKMQEVEDQDW